MVCRNLKLAAAAALFVVPTIASAETGGAVGGAIAGGAAGAVVGGPVGAAVGAGIGGAAGGAASGPDRNVVIEHRDATTTGTVGCSTTTTQKTDAMGDTTTKQKTNC